jgi:hypothetical protein
MYGSCGPVCRLRLCVSLAGTRRTRSAATARSGPRRWAASGVTITAVARGTPSLIALGYGKFVRADRVFALVPLEGPERGDGRRTLVYVEGLDEPLIASRSEGAIARDLADALGQSRPGGRRDGSGMPGQEALF